MCWRIARSVITDHFETKRYGVDNSPVGAFKATRQNSQIPQGPGSLRAFVDATDKDGLLRVLYILKQIDSILEIEYNI